MLMIEPLPRFSIPGRNARATRNMARTLTLNAWSQSLTLASRIEPLWTMPAQLNSTSMSPASCARRAMAASSVTSSWRARIPSLPSSACTCCPFRSVAHTLAPSRAKASAAACPMPCAAAVMNAVFPARRAAMGGSPCWRAAIILRVSMNQLDFAGRTAVVTGGAQGIGAAIAKRLQGSGAKVAIWDLDGTPRVDVADQASIESAVKRAVAELGKIDVLVNNAGIAGPSMPVVDYPVGEWKRVIDIDLNGPFLCCRAVLPHMEKARYGRIVDSASTAGNEGNPNAAAYAAAEGGLIAFTKALGKELAQTGVLVNCVTPAAAQTAILEQVTPEFAQYMLSKIPMGRFVKVEEIAALVSWLASNECSFSTGAVFDISGGRATY